MQLAPIITANWRANSGNVWTVPMGGGVGKIMKLGFQPGKWQAEFLRECCLSLGWLVMDYADADCIPFS